MYVNDPDPKSNYYASENERFSSLAYAKQEKMDRESKNSQKHNFHEIKRAKNFEKSFLRWEKMDEHYKKNQNILNKKKEKLSQFTSKKETNAFDIISLDYDLTKQGQQLFKKDIEKQKNEILRKKKLDKLNNVGYNIVNGKERMKIKLPIHTKTNYREQLVNESFSDRPQIDQNELFVNRELRLVGDQRLIGDDETAGRPARQHKKEFAKKYLNSWFDWQHNAVASTPQIVSKLNLEKLPPLIKNNDENYSSAR